MKLIRSLALLVTATLLALAPRGGAADSPYLGQWALHLPGGVPGWLGVEADGDGVKASILWGGGSVLPLDSARLDADKLILTRLHQADGKTPEGKKTKIKLTETITATRAGDTLKFASVKPKASGQGEDRSEFAGQRLPPMPPAPDLTQVRFGPQVPLFNGKDLSGLRLTDSGAVSGWSVKDGILTNNPQQEEGKPHKNYGNLRTDREFEDFRLTLEVRLTKGGNSGVYLRGIYEVQVADTFGKPLDAHNMGGIYSRIKPTSSAEKPVGEWQTLDLTLVNRHATVILNGVKIIDNQPVFGPTGGALWPEVDRPGPIYLQGDHTGIEYRNLVLRPVAN